MTASLSRRSLRRLLLAPVLLVLFGLLCAPGPARAGQLIDQAFWGGIAIGGYDPVAYFTEGQAVKGSEKFAHKWLGAIWYFSSAEHRDLFIADPVKYVPQYGGYCSAGMTLGETDAADPEAWRIVDGKLYLATSKAWLSVTDDPEKIKQANAHWEQLKPGLTQ